MVPRPSAPLAFVMRPLPPVTAGVTFLLLALAAPALAEPFSQQPSGPAGFGQERRVLPSSLSDLTPFYEDNLERPLEGQRWRDSHSFGEIRDRQATPSGFVASVGRLGLRVDSTDDGPRVGGLSWAASDSVSIVAGGNLGAGGGIGASLSLRIGF